METYIGQLMFGSREYSLLPLELFQEIMQHIQKLKKCRFPFISRCYKIVEIESNTYLSGFDKGYLQKFLATVSFEACSVLDHSFFFNDLFSAKIPLKAAVDQKTCI